jgi:hypothetical protein
MFGSHPQTGINDPIVEIGGGDGQPGSDCHAANGPVRPDSVQDGPQLSMFAAPATQRHAQLGQLLKVADDGGGRLGSDPISWSTSVTRR